MLPCQQWKQQLQRSHPSSYACNISVNDRTVRGWKKVTERLVMAGGMWWLHDLKPGGEIRTISRRSRIASRGRLDPGDSTYMKRYGVSGCLQGHLAMGMRTAAADLGMRWGRTASVTRRVMLSGARRLLSPYEYLVHAQKGLY